MVISMMATRRCFFSVKYSAKACRNSTLRSLPVAVIGISSRMRTSFGTWKPPRCLRQCSEIPASSAVAPGFSLTKADTASPHCGCGRPTTAAFCTAGCASSVSSIFTEATFSPPDLIMSFLRSRNSTSPLLVDQREIAGMVPAEFARLFGGLRVLVIAHHHVRPAMHEFAGLAARQQIAVVVHDRGLVDNQQLAPVIAEAVELHGPGCDIVVAGYISVWPLVSTKFGHMSAIARSSSGRPIGAMV